MAERNGVGQNQLQRPGESASHKDLDQPLRGQGGGLKIPPTVWHIGFMMLLMNASYVMIYSFCSVYMKNVLGASMTIIGLIEGACEILSHAMKPVSGMVSDLLKKRKIIIAAGYACSSLGKLVLAVSCTCVPIVFARTLERLGNGIQAAPRDAIVGDIAPKEIIGSSYGLKRTLAYIGSITGGVLGIIVMGLTDNDYPSVFRIAVIPALLAFAILIFLVKEPKKLNSRAAASGNPGLKPTFSLKNLRYLGFSYWVLMAINGIFMMSKMNETFLILRMNEGFISNPRYTPVVMIVFCTGCAIASYPVGLIGDKDKQSRLKLLYFGIISLILADVMMYFAASEWIMYSGILLWGIQLGSTQNVFVSMISEIVPRELRGTGHGCYWFINAISGLIADSLAGFISENFGLNYSFMSSGLIGIVALITLSMLAKTVSGNVARNKSGSI
jgi:predicted MFS family arabinose efflux permease